MPCEESHGGRALPFTECLSWGFSTRSSEDDTSSGTGRYGLAAIIITEKRVPSIILKQMAFLDAKVQFWVRESLATLVSLCFVNHSLT